MGAGSIPRRLATAPLGSMAPETSHKLSGSPPVGHLPPKLILLFYSEGEYLSEKNDVLIWLEHIFPYTYRRMNSMALPSALLTFVRGQRMTAEPSVLGGGGCCFPLPQLTNGR